MKRRRSPGFISKRRGGIRQRRRRREAQEALPNNSLLATLLLNLFAWGDMSAQLCQKIANAAYKDANRLQNLETDLKDLETIANIGMCGHYANKCYADLMKNIPLTIEIPHPTLVSLPFQSGSLLQGFILPHELFSVVFHSYPSTWSKCMAPSAERLAEFWATNSSHPAFEARNLAQIPDYQRICVPIALHGDDVPITGVGKSWCQLLTVFSWTSLCGFGNTQEAQWFIWGCWEKLRSISDNLSEDTLACFFQVLVWSFRWLQRGVWPDSDWNGKKPLAKISEVVFFQPL